MPLVTLEHILKNASAYHYAVGMFDVHNMEMAKAVIAASEEEKSPVILALAQIHAPTPEILQEVGSMMLYYARHAAVPVAVHLDHATSMEVIRQALKAGFSSVMYDGSTLSLEENIENSREAARLAHESGASAEAELGHVGGEEGIDAKAEDIMYTDVCDSVKFVKATGIDALAVSIGTVHGVYRTVPKLNLPLLCQIHKAVQLPLVLHGGSGLSDDDIRNCIRGGISKINIYTELIQAAKLSMEQHAAALSYPEMLEQSVNDMRAIVTGKTRLFNSAE